MSSPNESTGSSTTASDLVNVSKVADIFHAAAFALHKLGELVSQLKTEPSEASGDGTASSELSHWDGNDVEQFRSIITNFSDELNKLSNKLKNKISERLHAEHTEQAMAKTEDEQDSA